MINIIPRSNALLINFTQELFKNNTPELVIDTRNFMTLKRITLKLFLPQKVQLSQCSYYIA